METEDTEYRVEWISDKLSRSYKVEKKAKKEPEYRIEWQHIRPYRIEERVYEFTWWGPFYLHLILIWLKMGELDQVRFLKRIRD